MPAIGAGAASFLVCLLWEHIRYKSAPNGVLAAFLVSLSFIMGALSSYFRYLQYGVGLEENIIVIMGKFTEESDNLFSLSAELLQK